MHGGVDVGRGVGRDHAAEQGALESAGQAGLLPEGPEIGTLPVASPEQLAGCGACGLGVIGMRAADCRGTGAQIFYFRQAEQQRLARRLRGAARSVHTNVEGLFDRVQHIFRGLARGAQRRHHLLLDDVSGTDRRGAVRDVANGEFVFRHPPVPLEALRRDAGAHGVAERHPLGEPAVIAVQQSRRVGVQGVDLQIACSAGSALTSGPSRVQTPCLRSTTCLWSSSRRQEAGRSAARSGNRRWRCGGGHPRRFAR